MSRMPDILVRICAAKRDEISRLQEAGEEPLLAMARRQSAPRGFRAALAATDRVALIAEVKRASPSAGVIREDFQPAAIARQYEQGGARCLSVLTDAKFFQGGLQHMREARTATGVPVLRKDFLLDEIQLLEARAWGADCVLLIAAALGEPGSRRDLERLLSGARELGMDAMVEVHDERELEAALAGGADLVGVNSRDLHTFQVSLDTMARLAPRVPEAVTLVAESGIRSREDVEKMKGLGVDAVLIGESLMRATDVVSATRALSDV